MLNRYLILLLFLSIFLTFSDCNEESLLIHVDDEGVYVDDNDDLSPMLPGVGQHKTVYFYTDDINDSDLLKATVINPEEPWQLSLFGEPITTNYDFDFNKVYVANPDMNTETVLFLDEEGNPAFLYYKPSSSDDLIGGIIEFETIDDNQFYLRVYHYNQYSRLATILLESIIYVDLDDFYSNVTFGLANEEFTGGRISAEKKVVYRRRSSLRQFESFLDKTDKSNARTAATTLDEGVKGFLSVLEDFYRSPMTNWLIQISKLSGNEVNDKIGFVEVTNRRSGQYIEESLIFLSEFSEIISYLNPDDEPEFYASLNSNSTNISEVTLDLGNLDVSYSPSLRSLSNVYEHWYFASFNSFNEIFDYHEFTNLFLDQLSIERAPGIDGRLQVSLFWDSGKANLDLSIIEPNGDTVNLNNPISPNGATMLKADSEINGLGRELVFWQENAPIGEYVILCHYADCGTRECNRVRAEIHITNGLGKTIEINSYIDSNDLEKLKIGQFAYDGNDIE